jgi:hypothetical protein
MTLFTAPTWAETKTELATRAVLSQQSTLEAMANSMAGQTAQQLFEQAGQAISKVPIDKREAVGKEIQADIRRFYEDASALLRARAMKLAPTTMGPMLEEKMSEEELKQLVTWLESPAAKKFNTLGPELINAMQKQLISDTRASVEPKIRALEESLRKKLGVAAPAAPASGPKAGTKAPSKN